MRGGYIISQESTIRLDESWKQRLQEEFDSPYMQMLKAFLKQEKQAGKVIYPKGSDIFNALNHTPFDAMKVVILGQDPYHGPGQAHGLCFSVQEGVALPPSLKNIYQELERDLHIPPAKTGSLLPWADQGVLLLNSVLTVEQNQPASHQNRGWEQFTDRIIQLINEAHEHVVFMLWGAYAKKKGEHIERKRHLVLEAAHPSPFSVRGFMGCGHFSKANAYLAAHGKTPVEWRLG